MTSGIFSHGILNERSRLLNSLVLPKIGLSWASVFVECGALAWLDGDTYDTGEEVRLESELPRSNAPAGYDYKAQSFLFDGSTHIALPSTITLSGTLDISGEITPNTLAANYYIIGSVAGASGYLGLTAGGYMRLSVDSNTYTFSSITAMVVGTPYSFELTRSGTSATCTVTNLNTGTSSSETLTVTTGSIVASWIGGQGSAGTTGRLEVNLWNLDVGSTGNSIYCPCTDAVGTSIPMLINGSVAYGTLTGATLPDFYATHQDGVTGFNQNLLGFSQRENLLLQSQTFNESAWSKQRSSVSADAITAPDGTITADAFLADSTADATHNLYDAITVTLDDDTNYTYSLYAKKRDFDWLFLSILNKDGSYSNCNFDLSNGVTGTSTAISESIEDVGSGWYRCSLVTDSASGGSSPTVYMRIGEGDNDTILAGTVTGEGIYIWGAQLHEATNSTSYARTTSAPIQGIQPADPTDSSLDITGNALQYPGPIKKSAELTGYTGTWDGTAYGVLDSTVTLSGDFRVKALINGSSFAADSTIIAGVGTSECFIYLNGIAIHGYIANNYFTFGNVSFSTGTQYEIDISRSGSSLTLTATDPDGTVQTETITGESTSDAVIRYLAGVGATKQFTGSIEYIKLYNSSDTLIHHWVCESSSTSEQPIIYDVVGGNHATLTSATLPFFTTESQEATYLLENGWTEAEVKGSDLVTNGTFDTNISDWVIAGSNTVWESGEMKFVRDTAWFSSQAITVEVGKVYIATAKTRMSATNSAAYFRIGIIPGAVDYYAGSTTSTTTVTISSGIFVATNTTLNIALGAGADGDKTCYFDDVTLYEVPVGYIPAKATGGVSALDQTLTASPGEIRATEPGFWNMPQDKALIAADPANEMFDGSGDPQDLTYDDTDESPWLGDQLFGSDANGRIVFEDDLTGDCLESVDTFFEIS